jgi:hypothetical protein
MNGRRDFSPAIFYFIPLNYDGGLSDKMFSNRKQNFVYPDL